MRLKPRLLFVDDEPHVLSALARQLRRDFDVVTACGSEAGLEALTGGAPFEVVVADMQMPVMDGIAFLRVVHDSYPNAIRIMLSGNADMDTRTRAVTEAAIYRFLFKPCTSEDLLGTIKQALAEQTGEPAA